MKHLKLFEKFNNTIENTIEQQPFFLSINGNLYMSDKITNKIIDEYGTYNNDKNMIYSKMHIYTNEYDYSLRIRILSDYSNIIKKYGNFRYVMRAQSGDDFLFGGSRSDSGKMRSIQLSEDLLKKLYPIWSHIKDAMKRLKDGEKFFDIIESSIKNNPKLVEFVPDELKNIFTTFRTGFNAGLL